MAETVVQCWQSQCRAPGTLPAVLQEYLAPLPPRRLSFLIIQVTHWILHSEQTAKCY